MIVAPPLVSLPELSIAEWIASNPAHNLDEEVVYISALLPSETSES